MRDPAPSSLPTTSSSWLAIAATYALWLIDSFILHPIGLQRLSAATHTIAYDSAAANATMIATSAVASSQRHLALASTGGWQGWLARMWSGKESILPFVPKPVKYLLLFVFLLNYKSWPLFWHVKLWWPAIWGHIKAKAVGLDRYYRDIQIGVPLRADQARKLEAFQARQAELTPSEVSREVRVWKHKFEHPMGAKSVRRFYAGIDDCDYNMHLSNSAYAKNLDYARMTSLIDLMSPHFYPGGWMALGAAHYHFVREIPIFSEYEVQMSIGGFEDKWMYLIAEFVTYPKGNKGKRAASSSSTRTNAQRAAQAASDAGLRTRMSSAGIPDISQPPSGHGSPEDSGAEDKTLRGNKASSVSSARKPTAPTVEIRPDGSVLHCFAVSTYCFKIGRITVPPRVALSFCGYGDAKNWERASRLLHSPDRGRKWLQGGWKDEADEVGAEWTQSKDARMQAELDEGMAYGAKLKEAMEGLRKAVDAVPKVQ